MAHGKAVPQISSTLKDDFHRIISPDSQHSQHLDDLTAHYTTYPNAWAKWRQILRQPAAEFLGTMVLVLFGTGVNAQVTLSSSTNVSSSPKGDYLSVSFGWGVGISLAVWISGGISGGHVNPAVTLTMAVFRGFPWKKVPIYMISQLLGALCGAAVVYANYFHAIDLFEGGRGIRTVPGTAGLFATYSADYMTAASSFFQEFLATALLLLVVFATTDKNNLPPPHGLLPLVLFITFLGIAACFGMQTSFAVNPARDLGPRLLTAMVGYGGHVFSFRNQYWIWCGILAPFTGALFGGLIYDVFFFLGAESIINTPNREARTHLKVTGSGGGTVVGGRDEGANVV